MNVIGLLLIDIKKKNYFNKPRTLSGIDYNLVCFHRSAKAPAIFQEKCLATLNLSAKDIPILVLS